MVKLSILLIATVIPIALIALAGTASAVSVSIDTIQANGHYIGVPTIVNGETYTYGYNYTLVPDGTYTIMGTAQNDQDMPLHFVTNSGDKVTYGFLGGVAYLVPAHSSYKFSFTITPNPSNGYYIGWVAGAEEYGGLADLSNTNYVDAPQGAHTIDMGPMSNMVVVYVNGQLSSNTSILYLPNQSSSQINAIFSGGKFDFHGSPLYAFAE